MVPTAMSQSIPQNLPAFVRSELAHFSAERKAEFLEEYHRKSKSTYTAYLLWACFLHYFYLGRIALGFIFFLTGGGCFIWWFIDLFRTAGMVRNHNKDTATQVLQTMNSISR